MVIIVILLAFVLRLAGVGTFMTVDEEVWMTRSGEFYNKLFDKKDPGGTFTTTHPGATTQWLAGAGIYMQEKRLGAGVDTSNLNDFRLVSTVPMVMAAALLIGFITYLSALLMGKTVGMWAGILLAVEPYLVGMSQIVHVDMLLAMFMLAAILCLLLFIEHLKWRWLVMAGIMTGLAWATKLLPSLWLLIVSAGIIKGQYGWFIRAIKQRDWPRLRQEARMTIRQYVFFVGVAVTTFYMVWPALWVKTNLNDYYERDVVSIATQEHITLEEGEELIEPISYYGRTVLGRTSPLVLMIALGMAVVWLRYFAQELIWRHVAGMMGRHDGQSKSAAYITVRTIGWLIVYSAGYLAVISVLAKKADRYALPALVTMPLLAAVGLVIAGMGMNKKLGWRRITKQPKIIVGLLVVVLLAQPMTWMPYNIAYNNPLFNVRPLSTQGWGEGLDAAARWLNDHNLGERLTVASWYPGVMRTYFKGKTMGLSSRHDDRVGYVVTYRNMYGRGGDNEAADILKEYEDQVPEHVIMIGGKEYAWIYNVIGLKYFLNNVGELYGDMEVGQIVKAPSNWSGVEIGLANFSGRQNNQELVLSIRKKINDNILRTVKVNASEIEDMAWHQFDFAALDNSQGEEFYLSLTSPKSHPGNAVTVLFSMIDLLEGQMVWRPREGQEGNTEKWLRENFDIAYRFSESLQR